MPAPFAITVQFPNLLTPETPGDLFGLLAFIVALGGVTWQWWTHHCAQRDQQQDEQAQVRANRAAQDAVQRELDHIRAEVAVIANNATDERLKRELSHILERLKHIEQNMNQVRADKRHTEEQTQLLKRDVIELTSAVIRLTLAVTRLQETEPIIEELMAFIPEDEPLIRNASRRRSKRRRKT